jgi:glucose/mannose-6-phosphate isomerase
MGRLIEGAPLQILEALGRPGWPASERAPDLLAVGAMGGSAIAADLTAALFRGELPRPMLVVRDYRLPPCVTPASLLLLASHSGNTEETLALADEARARGVPWVGLTTGGRLGDLCDAAGVTRRGLPTGAPPRAVLYASWVAVTRLVAALGWIADPVPAWREAATTMEARVAEWRRDRPETSNSARQMAHALAGRLAFVYAEQRLEPLAVRWRQQLNENAKLLAHSAVVPELNHNEVVGWEKSGMTSGAAVVLLRDGLESAPNETRLALTAEYLRGQGVVVVEPPAPAGSPLARAATLALLGDFVSYYLAMSNGVDPTPIASLDEFKRRLAERRASQVGGAS